MTAADPRDGLHGLVAKWRTEAAICGIGGTRAAYKACADELETALTHARPEAVDERVVREVAIAINYAWIGVDGSARQWWNQLGSNERKHKDDVARAAIAAYHEAITPERAP